MSVAVHMTLNEAAIMHYLPWETTIFALSEIYLFPINILLIDTTLEVSPSYFKACSDRFCNEVCTFLGFIWQLSLFFDIS